MKWISSSFVHSGTALSVNCTNGRYDTIVMIHIGVLKKESIYLCLDVFVHHHTILAFAES